jgi:hypothetical protein
MAKKHGSKEQKKAQKRKKKRKQRKYTARNEKIYSQRRYEAALLEEAGNREVVREDRSKAATQEQKDAMNDINKLTSIQHKRHNSVSAASLFEKNRSLIPDGLKDAK